MPAVLEQVDEYKYLGALIDSTMSFKPHTNKLVTTLSHKLYLLARIRKFLNEEKAFLLYRQMIMPYIDYASFLIDCTTKDLV